MKLYKLLKGINFEVINGGLDVEISGMEDNSKNIKNGNVFFAIQGTRVNGEEYIKEAVLKGSVAVFVESDIVITEELKNITIIKVVSVRSVIGLIAKNYYSSNGYCFKVIGVTGTNGKTTTSFVIAEGLIRNGYNVCVVGTSGIFINGRCLRGEALTTPDPIELQSLFGFLNEIKIDYVVMEVSAHALDLEKTNGVEFAYSIFSNLTEDHLDYFKDMEKYGKAKLKLFYDDKSNVAIVNVNDPFSGKIIQNRTKGIVTYGEKQSQFKIKKLSNNCFKLIYNNKEIHIKCNLTGIYNMYNITSAFIVLLSENIGIKFLKKYAQNLPVVDGRYNEFNIKNHGKIILDFAHTPDGLEKLLENVREKMKGKGKLISVFGCGGNRDKGKRAIMGEVSGKLSDYTIISIDNPRFEDENIVMGDIEKGVKSVSKDYEIIMPRSLAIKKAIEMSDVEDYVVISGKGTEPYYEVNGKKEFYREDIVIDCIKKNIER